MMTRWNTLGWGDMDRTFQTMNQLRRRMERLFEDYDVEDSVFGRSHDGSPDWPAANLYDHEGEFVVQAVVPGLGEDDFEISVTGDVLTLAGRRAPEIPEGYSVHRRERGAVRFARSFTLPTRVEADKASATLRDGVLTLRLPKAAESRPRRISVNQG